MGRKELLFKNYELRAVLEGHRKEAEGAVVELPATEVAAETEESVLDRLEEEYRVVPLELLEDKATVEQEEAQADVSGDPLRFIRDRSQPFYVPGQRVRYYVPYRGDQELWRCRPSRYTLNPPSADVAKDEIVFEFTVPSADIAQTRGWFDTAIASVRQWISFSKQDVEMHNQQLRPILRDALRRRRNLLATAAKEVEALGLPVRRKVGPAPEIPMPVAAPSARTARGRMPPPETQEYDVALSFAGEDREYVEQVATLLLNAGIRVFYDKFETVKLWGEISPTIWERSTASIRGLSCSLCRKIIRPRLGLRTNVRTRKPELSVKTG